MYCDSTDLVGVAARQRVRGVPKCLRHLVLVASLCLAACTGKSPEELLASAQALQAKGERNGAILQLKSAIQEYPEHGESRLALGLMYNETGDFRGAEKELRRAMDLRVDHAKVFPALGKALLMQGEAKKVLEEISADGLKASDQVASVLSTRGLAHLALGQFDEARAAFGKALAVHPGSPDALLGQARVLASERKIDEALAEVDRALVELPNNVDALMLRGDLFRFKGRTDEAVSAYQKAVETRPDHVNALLALVSMNVASANYDVATQHLASVRKHSPGNSMASYFQALIEFRKGNFKVARDAIGQVLKVAPNHLPSVLLGGAVDFALGSHELAQTRLRYVLDRAPGNLYARRLLIASYARAGQTHKALELLEPVLKRGVKDPAILALAGEVHMQLNEYEKATDFFQKATALDPKNPAMRTGLGLSRLAAGETDLATADLESASQLDTTRHQADVLLISTHLQRRQYDQALKSAQALVQKQPENPMSHNLLAAAYIGKKDIGAARKSLEKALVLLPSYTPAAANLAQLDLQSGDKKSARKRFEDIIGRDKENVQAYIALASLGPRIDATQEEIRRWLESARRESPGTIQPLVMLARFYFQAKEPKKALEVMEKAMIGASDNPEVLELAGQVQLAAGEKNRALATFSKWLAVQPNSAQAHFRMATAQRANEDWSGAASSLRRALAYRPVFLEAQTLLIDTEARNGRVGEAFKIVEQMKKQDPRSPAGWIIEGDLLMQTGKPGPAVMTYEKAYTLARSGATVMKLHAALTRSGKTGEAEKRLKDWLKAQPNDLPVRLYLAESYIKQEKYKNAVEEYESLLGSQSGNVVVLNNLAWGYQQVKDARAVGIAEKAISLNPENPAVMDTLGWILVESGNLQRGLELLKKAAALAPKSPDIRYHYAQALVKSADKDHAKAELERLLLDFPSFAGSDGAMKLLVDLRK